MTIELGNRLAELRKEHGYSQEELADKLGVSRQAISKWERGEASPDTDNLIELSRIYGVSLDELLGLEGSSQKEKAKKGSKINVTINANLNHEKNEDEDEDDEDDDDSTIRITKDGVLISDSEDTVHINKSGVHINEEHVARDRKKEKIVGFVSLLTTFGVVIAYILLGTLLGLWGQAWVLFLLIPIAPSLAESIVSKNAYHFAYPVFIVFLYLLLCVWILNFSLWHPLWVMFLTIPIYYGLIKLFFKEN